jgi:hypothetical protein
LEDSWLSLPDRNFLGSGPQMEVTLRLKFTQHKDLKALLLGTGDAELVEVKLGDCGCFF